MSESWCEDVEGRLRKIPSRRVVVAHLERPRGSRMAWFAAVTSMIAVLASGCRGLDARPGKDAGTKEDALDDLGTWILMDIPTSADLLSGASLSSDLYVVGSSATILRSTNMGSNWVTAGVADFGGGYSYPKFRSIGGSGARDIWVAGDLTSSQGILIHSTDRGQSWETIDIGISNSLQGVWSADVDHVYVVSYDGGIVSTSNGGAQWSCVFDDPNILLWGVWGSRINDIYAVGATVAFSITDADLSNVGDGGAAEGGVLSITGGVVLHSSDEGLTWQTMTAAPCPLWHVSGVPDGTAVYAAGSCGTIAWTTDHGASWSTTGDPAVGNVLELTSVAVSPGGVPCFTSPSGIVGWVVASASGWSARGVESLPARLYEGGTAVRTTPLGLWFDSDGSPWAVGSSGFLWHDSASR